ncbi:MAG: hypothetical protein NZ529_00125 [Cytophagaceae bacterium]|nr:hypothetical protein [Cytophagaceae bacterium]MDW8455171.1 hypothetical protein [Cytophagaceae bacterium]
MKERIQKKYVTIVNRHYPPNPGITGESAWDLAKYLIDNHDVEVRIVCIKKNDEGGGAIRKPVGKVYAIPTLYKGKHSVFKSVAGITDGLLLILTSLFVRKGKIICMTSPPLLPFWASLFYRLFRVKWFFWSMDLFPEAFAAAKKMEPHSWLYKIILNITYSYKPELLISLGPNQCKYILNHYKAKPEFVILPCGVFIEYAKDTTTPDWAKHDGKIIFGYCGNLGTPHSVEFLKSFIECMNPSRHHLVLALYGIHAQEILSFAKNKSSISIVPQVPRTLLHHIDVHLVSLLPEFNHTAVPSKGMSAICTGGTMLFCGTTDSDTWHLLKDASWLIDLKMDMKEQLEIFFASITHEVLAGYKSKSLPLANSLYDMQMQAYAKIYRCL